MKFTNLIVSESDKAISTYVSPFAEICEEARWTTMHSSFYTSGVTWQCSFPDVFVPLSMFRHSKPESKQRRYKHYVTSRSGDGRIVLSASIGSHITHSIQTNAFNAWRSWHQTLCTLNSSGMEPQFKGTWRQREVENELEATRFDN